MSTNCLPWNWLRLIWPPMVLDNVKSGAFSPTSRAVVSCRPPSILTSNTPTSTRLLMRCLRLSMASLLCMTGHCLHTTLAYQGSMVAHMVSPLQVAVSADEPIALGQPLRGNRESQGFSDLQIE